MTSHEFRLKGIAVVIYDQQSFLEMWNNYDLYYFCDMAQHTSLLLALKHVMSFAVRTESIHSGHKLLRNCLTCHEHLRTFISLCKLFVHVQNGVTCMHEV